MVDLMIDIDSLAPGASRVDPLQERRIDILLAAYEEVCKSYHAIDEFRTKLLGILPIASLAGIILLGKDNLFQEDVTSQRLIGFASFFAAAFTLSLFLFEIRGIIRCHHLIKRGAKLEDSLNVKGQFTVCSAQHRQADTSMMEGVFNTKVAACAVYSLVFAAWFFLGLRFTFGFHLIGCGLTATILGGLLGWRIHSILSTRIPA